MINDLLTFLTNENIYLAANWGVIPFWLLLIFAPNHQLTNFFAQSIVAPLLLAGGYIYLSYSIYLEGNIFDGFELYVCKRSFVINLLASLFIYQSICWCLDCKR